MISLNMSTPLNKYHHASSCLMFQISNFVVRKSDTYVAIYHDSCGFFLFLHSNSQKHDERVTHRLTVELHDDLIQRTMNESLNDQMSMLHNVYFKIMSVLISWKSL